MLFLIWTSVLLTAVVLYLRQKCYRFSRYGVKYFKPWAMGNYIRVALKVEPLCKLVENTYNVFPEERFVGRFDITLPVVMIRDIELLKKVAIKDFEHFSERKLVVDQDIDLFGKNLLALKGQDWKDMRSTMSPVFTSSKIRHMIPFMVEVGDAMVLSLKKKIKESKVDYIDIDCKNLTSRYSNDVIATCAFGLKINSYAEENNEFYRMAKEMTTPSVLGTLKFLFYCACPKLMKMLHATLLPKYLTDYFAGIISKTIEDREQKNIIRPDMIHLIMEAKKGKLTHDKTVQNEDAGFATAAESSIGKTNVHRDLQWNHALEAWNMCVWKVAVFGVWSDDDLYAQAMVFFFAAYETVSSTLSFALYELAKHPDIQDRLVQEIRNNNIKNEGQFDYNSVQKMTYLDMVVTETLRLWPIAPHADRRCLKDYNLGKPNENTSEDYIIRKGEDIDIPIWAIQRDPKFYPDPVKFDPERFSEENKKNIKPFTYIPFGIGPRNCIGSRFALCEMKVMIYLLLQQIEVSPCEKTCIPPQLDATSLPPRLKGGHWLRFKIRN